MNCNLIHFYQSRATILVVLLHIRTFEKLHVTEGGISTWYHKWQANLTIFQQIASEHAL